jgi:hypothetical protein
LVDYLLGTEDPWVCWDVAGSGFLTQQIHQENLDILCSRNYSAVPGRFQSFNSHLGDTNGADWADFGGY